MELCQQALNILRRAAGQSGQDKDLKSTNIRAIKNWCEQHDIELKNHLRANNKLRIDALLIARIEQVRNQLGLAPLAFNPSGKTSSEQLSHGLGESKSVRASIKQSRVLAAFACTESQHYLINSNFLHVSVDFQAINLLAFNALVVIENLDVFYQQTALGYLQQQLDFSSVLFIYRGDKQESRYVKHILTKAMTSQLPCIYFGDFDAKGVNIALSEGYSHLLLAEYSILIQHASALHQPSRQELYKKALRQYLEQYPHSLLTRYLTLIVSHNKGLLQQRITATQIPLHLVPLASHQG